MCFDILNRLDVAVVADKCDGRTERTAFSVLSRASYSYNRHSYHHAFIVYVSYVCFFYVCIHYVLPQ